MELRKITLAILLILIFPSLAGALPYRPDAIWSGNTGESFGIDTPGGSGRHLGTPATNICRVNVLTDNASGSNGSGSVIGTYSGWTDYRGDLRYCMKTVLGPKTVIFETSGNIQLQDKIELSRSVADPPDEDCDYTTIAGQTAPSPGITILNYNLHFQDNCNDIIIQHIRSRAGDYFVADLGCTTGNCVKEDIPDGIQISGKNDGLRESPSNIVIDHSSFSWASDMNVQVGGNNVTYVDSITSEALRYPDVNPQDDDGHSKGWMCNTDAGGDNSCNDVAVVRSLFVHNQDRNPYYKGGEGIIVNNVIFDTKNGISSIFANDSKINTSIVGNYIDETEVSNGYTIRVALGSTMNDPGYEYCYGPCGTDNEVFWANDDADCGGVVCPKNFFGGSTQNAWSGPNTTNCLWWSCNGPCDLNGDPVPAGCRASDPPRNGDGSVANHWPVGYAPLSADPADAPNDIKTYVLANAGARPADRCTSPGDTTGDCDPVDYRIVADVIAGSNSEGWIHYISDHPTNSPGATGKPCRDYTGAATTCVQNAEGGYPPLDANYRELTIPANPHEVQPSGYTRLEELLHTYSDIVEGNLVPQKVFQ